MKKVFKIIIIALCLIKITHSNAQAPQEQLINGISASVVSVMGCQPNTVQKIDDPYIYQGECSIGIKRYLSRASDVGFLQNLRSDDLRFDPINTSYNVTQYANLIKTLTDLNIQFVQRAYFGAAGNEHQFFINENHWNLGFQIVKDINYAYDCKGLPRPIIQGMSYEYYNIDNFDLMPVFHDPINSPKTIPSWIIDIYFNQIFIDEKPANQNYYFTNGTPKSSLFFQKNRIFLNNGLFNFSHVECRLWLFYQAVVQINMGYTAIHSGIYWSYASNNYILLDKLLNGMRTYAKNKVNHPGFVLISGETPMQDVDNGLSAKVPGTNKFIFDFDSRAMRPREIANTTGDGNANSNGCQQTAVQESLFDAVNLNCGTQNLKAIVDPCTIESLGGSSSGISPLGCFVSQQPYTVHFDGFSAPINPNIPSNGPSSLTWGFNDHDWFSLISDENCKAWWFDFFYCDRKNYHNENGFIVIPGIINGQFNMPPNRRENLITLNTQDILIQKLKNSTLNVKLPELEINEICTEFLWQSCNCNGSYAPLGTKYLAFSKCYNIDILNKDCSSTYSIHIKKPNGMYFPQSLVSSSYSFCPEMVGTYEITIRQDNLGLNTPFYNQFGTRDIKTYFYIDNLTCCIEESGNCWEYFRKVSTHENELSVEINPNPSLNILNIYTKGFSNNLTKFEIINMYGSSLISNSIVSFNGSDSYEIPVNNLNSGTYILKISDGKNIIYKKFIKQ